MKFNIKGEYIQLNQLLKILRFSQSGGQAKLMIEDGEIKVNGEVEYRIRAKIYPGYIVQAFDKSIEIEK